MKSLFIVCFFFLALAQPNTFTVTIEETPNYPNPPAWGVSIHLDGHGTPEVYLYRGIEYTFVLKTTANHPIYITDDEIGGLENPNARIFAGGANAWGTDAQPFILKWTPNAATPSIVYYQCYTHQKLGWKAHILDAGSAIPLVFTLGPNPNYPGSPVSMDESLYVNGLESPTLQVVRGQSYRLIASAGLDHPIYLTSDPNGGSSNPSSQVFAGGSSFRGTESQPTVISWTPDGNVPDLIYYHDYQTQNLGWKINVVDSGASWVEPVDRLPEASTPLPNDMTLPVLSGYDNCRELISEEFRLYWTVVGGEIRYAMQSRRAEAEWMAFGISANQNQGEMIGADVTVAYAVQGQIYAVDYFLSDRLQCNNAEILAGGDPVGVCPDGGRREAASLLDSGSYNNGVLTVHYTKSMQNPNQLDDISISATDTLFAIWARGPLCDPAAGLVCYHQEDKATTDFVINFSESSSCLPQIQEPCFPTASSEEFTLPSGFTEHGVAGRATILSKTQIRVDDFSYDGYAPRAYFALANRPNYNAAGNLLLLGDQLTRGYSNEVVIVNLPEGVLDQFESLTVYCVAVSAPFGFVTLPSYNQSCSNCWPSSKSSDFTLPSGSTLHAVTGHVQYFSENRIAIRNFSYDGTAPDVHIRLVRNFDFINGYNLGERLTRAYENEDLVFDLPSNAISLFDSVSIFCARVSANFGSAPLPIVSDACYTPPVIPDCYPTPESANFNLASGFTIHGLTGRIVVDSPTKITVYSFSYDGRAPAAYFYLGNNNNFGSSASLRVGARLTRAYDDESFELTIPEGSLEMYTQLSLYCEIARSDFGHLTIPVPDSSCTAIGAPTATNPGTASSNSQDSSSAASQSEDSSQASSASQSSEELVASGSAAGRTLSQGLILLIVLAVVTAVLVVIIIIIAVVKRKQSKGHVRL